MFKFQEVQKTSKFNKNLEITKVFIGQLNSLVGMIIEGHL